MMVSKGKVSSVSADGKTVTVVPYSGDFVTVPLTVPFFLIGATPVNTPVVYTTFSDNTGIVISRMDGEWNHSLQKTEEGE